MKDPQIILCNESGVPTGRYLPKEEGHIGRGKKHLAITVLLYNSKREVLIQRRKHKRFDDIWDITGATDLYHKNNVNESFEQATLRCLKREYSIKHITVTKIGAFNYFAQYKDLCENEYCAVMIGEYNGPVKLNSEVGYGYLWIKQEKLLNEMKGNPHYFSPWSIEAIKILKMKGFPKDHD